MRIFIRVLMEWLMAIALQRAGQPFLFILVLSESELIGHKI